MFSYLSRNLIENINNLFDIHYTSTYTFSRYIGIAGNKSRVFTLQIEPGHYVEYGFYIFFSLSLITQICLPCYFGNEVIVKSERLPLCAYSSHWYQFSPIYKKNLIMFMERMKRTSHILIGKMFPLSLATFTSVSFFFFMSDKK